MNRSAKKSKKQKKKPSHSFLQNFLWSLGMLQKYSPAALVIMASFVLLNLALQYLNIYLPALVASEVTNAKPLAHALGAVGGTMLAIMLCNMLKDMLGYIKQSRLSVYRRQVSHLLVKKKLNLFYQTYEKKEVRDLAYSASLATQMWDGVQPLIDIVTNGFGMIENLLGYLLFGTLISFASPWLVPLLTIAPAVHIISMRLYRNWEYSRRETVRLLETKQDYIGGITSDFSSAKDIRIYSMASWLREAYRSLSAKHKQYDRQSANRMFGANIARLCVILIRDGGAYALLISMILSGKIRVDQFILYFAAISSFASWIEGIVNHWNGIHSASLRICDFRDYIDYPEPKEGDKRTKEWETLAPEIIFDHVCFRYDGTDADTLHDISFTMHSGEKLALVGLNGAGKTTIVKLLCGLYYPTSGEIFINGVPIRQFHRKDYYKLISPVFQDAKSSFFSFAEIVSGRALADTDRKKAEECLRRAGLGQKLDTLKNGVLTKLNKHVNQDATELSGGEIQKLMLARALYKDAPLLILDEPTAALDPIAESNIYTEYNRMTQNKTALFISHRLASTSFCDRVLLLKNGKITEEGTHKELLRQNGEYKKLFDIQSCWYQENGGTAL